MAENEILDVGGRRWRSTRAALANLDLSLTAVAEKCRRNRSATRFRLPCSAVKAPAMRRVSGQSTSLEMLL